MRPSLRPLMLTPMRFFRMTWKLVRLDRWCDRFYVAPKRVRRTRQSTRATRAKRSIRSKVSERHAGEAIVAVDATEATEEPTSTRPLGLVKDINDGSEAQHVTRRKDY